MAGRNGGIAASVAWLLACNEPLAPPGGKAPPKVTPRDASAEVKAVSLDATVAPPVDAAAPPVDAAPPVTFYAIGDALADAKASPLKRLGIGAWPGNYSIKGCIYKNDRVFVVDVYCTYKEQVAFSVIVIHPTKGEVRIYAEANDPISTVERSAYFTFNADSYAPDAPPPDLKTATFDQVTAWQDEFDKHWRVQGAVYPCGTDMTNCADPTWLAPAKDFIESPGDDWRWVVDQLRNRAQHDGKYVKK